jgi:hypothetical protein
MLLETLKSVCWDAVPQKIQLELTLFNKANVQKNLRFTGELLRLVDLFKQNAIPIAAIKGPVLAHSVYGRISLREFSDLDVIVQEGDLSKAEEILTTLGYQADFADREYRSAFLSYQGQYAFRHSNTGISIDLHWQLSSKGVAFPFQSAEIWPRLEQVTIAGRTVRTLADDDLALFLVAHGTKEGWRCLSWVADFAMFIEKHPDLDWGNLLDRARRRGCSRSLLVGWQLAARLLGTQVDADLLGLAKNNMQARLTAEALDHRIRNEYPVPASGPELSELELCESRLQRARAIGNFLTTRTISDYVSMPLPRPLWRIYHLTRPFRLAGKIIRNPGSIKERRQRILSRFS